MISALLRILFSFTVFIIVMSFLVARTVVTVLCTLIYSIISRIYYKRKIVKMSREYHEKQNSGEEI